MLNTSKKRVWILFSVGIGVLVGLVVASNFNLPKSGNAKSELTARVTETSATSTANPNKTTSTPINNDLAATNRAFVQVAKKVIPTVVSITSEKVVNVRNPFSDFSLIG